MSIYPRTNYEMTEGDLKELLDSMRMEPVMKIGSYWSGGDRQERANAAWERLGKKMGFDYTTVRPDLRGTRFFTAVPSETEAQRVDRLATEAEAKRLKEIFDLNAQIETAQKRIAELDQLRRDADALESVGGAP